MRKPASESKHTSVFNRTSLGVDDALAVRRGQKSSGQTHSVRRRMACLGKILRPTGNHHWQPGTFSLFLSLFVLISQTSTPMLDGERATCLPRGYLSCHGEEEISSASQTGVGADGKGFIATWVSLLWNTQKKTICRKKEDCGGCTGHPAWSTKEESRRAPCGISTAGNCQAMVALTTEYYGVITQYI